MSGYFDSALFAERILSSLKYHLCFSYSIVIVTMSERPRTTVSLGALHPGLQC